MSEALILTLLQYGLKYGIPAVEQIITTLKKPDSTLADVEAMFGAIKKYDEYEIPALIPPPASGLTGS